ncbi:sugar kinase [Streptomyces sp. NBC_00656]|uniref:sugar kinase n=1 Tax=Streptomyces sp. NBC_00656 TaxID=2903668 RepID=UPI00324F13BF
MSPDVVVCGETMLLMLAEPGVPLEHAVSFRRSIAGAESNVAAGLARLGHSVRWLGRVGDDPAGRAVLAQLRAHGVDSSYAVTDPEAPTGVLMRDSHPARAIDVQYLRAGSAASRLSPHELQPRMFQGARLVHITGITPMLSDSANRATWRLVELARAAGAVLSFDPNIRHKLGTPARWREVVTPLLSRADVVMAGEDEWELLGVPDPAALLGTGPRTIVVKHRDKSATCLTSEAEAAVQPAFDVPVSDPVGAGDAFAAGFLSGLLHGHGPDQCLRQAAVVAALVVQCPTDTDGLPNQAGLDRALAGFTDAGSETVIR